MSHIEEYRHHQLHPEVHLPRAGGLLVRGGGGAAGAGPQLHLGAGPALLHPQRRQGDGGGAVDQPRGGAAHPVHQVHHTLPARAPLDRGRD